MQYISTRDAQCKLSSKKAILQGISSEGGLFVPDALPTLSTELLSSLTGLTYNERAVQLLSLFLSDFTEAELTECVARAYSSASFEGSAPTELVLLTPNTYLLELWHGPTSAFKDVALQLLPHLMEKAMQAEGDGKTVVVLVATSGDTGKAAMEGFRDIEGTHIIVFYPSEGVSTIQKLQMLTQEGANVTVMAVAGNFDDCQTRVKELFADPVLAKTLTENNMLFSSANSINWGRLVPQIVYYVSAYCDLVAEEELALGEHFNVVVPTGNFGNILAAYYAKEMGVPIARLICASNQNNVLTEFIRTGSYDSKREFFETTSPSMDIIISSNLERFLFELSGRDDEQVCKWMRCLKTTGEYSITEAQLAKLQEGFYGGFCTDMQCANTISEVFDSYSYLCDTHTAVALNIYRQYVGETNDKTKTMVVSTANPHKFASAVLAALEEPVQNIDDFLLLDCLAKRSGLPVPPRILELKEKPLRFTQVVSPDNMAAAVFELLDMQK